MAGPPKLPYGGPEETSEVRRRRATHPAGLAIDKRVERAEERAAGAEEVAIAVGRDIAGLREDLAALAVLIESLKTALRGPEHQPEHGLLWKVTHLDQRRRRVDKTVWTLLTAACLGLAAWVVQLYAATHRGG